MHRSLAKGLGWHNTKILEIYMGHEKVAWGILAVLLVLVVPASRPRRAVSPTSPAPPWSTVGGEPRDQWLDAKVFLLLFSLLTLAEFALLPTLMRDDSLRGQDILDAERLVQRLNAEESGAATSLRRRLSVGTLRLLSEFGSEGPGSARVLDALLADLNRVISGPLLAIAGSEFRGVEFRRKTLDLYRSGPEEDDRQYFNRLVIEDVFPGELARRDFMGFHFRTFTGRTYRYLLMPAYGLSLAMAVALGMIVDFLGGALIWLGQARSAWRGSSQESRAARRARERRERKGRRRGGDDDHGRSALAGAPRWPSRARAALMVLTFALVCNHVLHAKGYGNWPPTSKPSERQALQWMLEHLPDDARIIANWFNADFVRTYSARAGRPMPSIFAGSQRRSGVRLNIRAAVKDAGLEIPDMTSTREILDYARENPGSYYVLKTRFGPWLSVEREPAHFSLIATFPAEDKPINTVQIFELTSNRVRIVPTR